ncbi:kinase [Enterococcus florum]|uniref:Kinase n=1 Tax=Enterococcus florum TaxID=2480627 RepID=A0A4V0WPT3_9ENTE|nr:AAA family ATPase [Enterococcus florum]GCF94959.1 kinase [Enterococcus florum]
MNKTLILLAGYPGTGKTYLANGIMERFPEFCLLSPDEIKEKNWDLYGFNSLKEKERLIQQSWQEYYETLEDCFKRQIGVISDYPFSDKQRATLHRLSKIYSYQVITVRLIADLDVLFQRQQQRDLDETRHLGHIVKCYQKNQVLRHDEADNLLTYDEFKKRCTTRGYESFALGILFELDVTDFNDANYEKLYGALEKIMNG